MRTTACLSFTAAIAALLASASSSARAEDAARDARLRYAAPAGCASSDGFAGEVAARLGYSPWNDRATQIIDVAISEAGTFVATLQTSAGVRTMRADSCDVLTDALAAAVAVTLDRGALDGLAARPVLTVTTAPVAAPSVVVQAAPMAPTSLVMQRRWKASTPWLIAGAGVAGLLTAGGLQLLASADMDAYNATIEKECSGTDCTPEILGGPNRASWVDGANAHKDRAYLENAASVGLFVVGGAATITGLVMAVVNTPRASESPARPTVGVAPLAGGAAVSLTGGF